MKFGYDLKIDGTAYKGMFDENNTKVLETKGEYITKSNETKLENGVILRLVSEEDTVADVMKCRMLLDNQSSNTVRVEQASIANILPIPFANLQYFTSDWGSEFSPIPIDVTYPINIGSYTGRSSKGCDPFFTVGWENTGFMGVVLGWSGNWKASFRRLDGENYIATGLLDEGFFTDIAPSQTFENIDIFYTFAEEGREEISRRFRKYYRRNITLFEENIPSLPVEYNHWWPYEDKYINEDVFYNNAKVVKDLGFSNTMLDAGWFGPAEEVDVNQSMPWFLKRGDWDLINTKLFPSGIEALGKKVNALGIKFGMWCEIEAIGSEAKFNEVHPELIAKRDGKSLQYVCMGNPESVEWALDVVKTLVDTYGASWLKFDFNLDPGFGCDCEEHGHGKGDGLYAHYIGYYHFLDEVHKRHPHVIIENCSSGGLRIDYGIMKYSHVAHLSDPDHTKHHMQCFWGATSYVHPSSCLHFTWSETVGDHNIERNPYTVDLPASRLDYIIRSVLTGVPGYSLKFVELPEWILLKIKEHTAFYKRISKDYIFNGEMFRLTAQTGSDLYRGENWNAFQFTATEERHIVFVYKLNELENTRTIKLQNLQTTLMYKVYFQNTGETKQFTGVALMEKGISFASDEDVWSEVLEIEAVRC